MGHSEPKRQHYIPEMLLRKFCNPDGRVWVADRGNVYETHPRNVFVESHLYTRSDFSKVPRGASHKAFLNSVGRGYEYEEQLGKIESCAAPAIERIIDQARKEEHPRLSTDFREAWKRFLIAIARRTPESQERVSESRSDFDVFYEAAMAVADLDNYPLPTKEELYRDLRVLVLKRMVMSNANAKFAAGDDPRIEAETKRFSEDIGLSVVVIRIPKRSFVIGSHGLTLLDHDYGRPLGANSWLPIAHDVAVGATAFPDREFLTVLDGRNDTERIITAFNRATANGSKVVAGESEALVRSLTCR